MILIAIIVGLGVAAAIIAFALSASRKIEVDTVDPTVAERAVKRSIRHHPKVRRFLEQRMDRTTAGGYLLTAAFALVFAASLVLGFLLVLIDNNSTMQDVDRRVSEWGSTHAGSEAVDVVEVVTHLGTTWVVFLVLAVVATADFIRRRNYEVFAFVVAIGLGEMLLNNLLKVIIRRERPAVMHLMDAHGFSFPSGHTAAAAACWSAVALVLGRDRPARSERYWPQEQLLWPSSSRRAGRCSASTGSAMSLAAWPSVGVGSFSSPSCSAAARSGWGIR